MPLSITHRRGVVGEAGAAIVVAAEKKWTLYHNQKYISWIKRFLFHFRSNKKIIETNNLQIKNPEIPMCVSNMKNFQI